MHSNKNGKLISFSGIDGVGKTTQIELLKNALQSTGSTCEDYRFSLEDFGERANGLVESFLDRHIDWVFTRLAPDFADRVPLVKGLVYDEKLQTTRNGLATTLIFAGGSVQVFENCIHALLASGVNIVCDRYWFDEIAFRGRWIGRSLLIDLYRSLPVPDLAFYLDASPEFIFERNRSRVDGKSPFMQSKDIIAELRQEFIRMTTEFGLAKVDAMRPVDQVRSDVTKLANQKMGLGLK